MTSEDERTVSHASHSSPESTEGEMRPCKGAKSGLNMIPGPGIHADGSQMHHGVPPGPDNELKTLQDVHECPHT